MMIFGTKYEHTYRTHNAAAKIEHRKTLKKCRVPFLLDRHESTPSRLNTHKYRCGENMQKFVAKYCVSMEFIITGFGWIF